MSRPALLLLALSPVAFLVGCGGGQPPLVLTGDYFPHAVGASWQYNLQTKVETATASFAGAGTMARTVVRRQPVLVNGSAADAYVIAHSYTVDAAPGPDLGLPPGLRALVDLLFSTTSGGLQPVEAYYVTNPVPAVPGSAAETLVGLTRSGGAMTPTQASRPFVLSPPMAGEAHATDLPLIPMPLVPSAGQVRDPSVVTRTLDYDDVGNPLGLHHAVYYFEQYSGLLPQAGRGGTFSGRGRMLLQDSVGLSEGDWAVVLDDGSTSVRVSFTFTGQSYATP